MLTKGHKHKDFPYRSHPLPTRRRHNVADECQGDRCLPAFLSIRWIERDKAPRSDGIQYKIAPRTPSTRDRSPEEDEEDREPSSYKPLLAIFPPAHDSQPHGHPR